VILPKEVVKNFPKNTTLTEAEWRGIGDNFSCFTIATFIRFIMIMNSSDNIRNPTASV
jgi:hypothetical protein